MSLVSLDGVDWVVDVGFGPMGPPHPVAIEMGPSDIDDLFYRVRAGRRGEFHLQVLKGEDWYSLYRFDRVRYGQSDCEVGHFYSHRHPEATFVNNLVASLILDDEVRSLRNREYWVLRGDGGERVEIEDAASLRSLLVGELGLNVTEDESGRLFDGLPPLDVA